MVTRLLPGRGCRVITRPRVAPCGKLLGYSVPTLPVCVMQKNRTLDQSQEIKKLRGTHPSPPISNPDLGWATGSRSSMFLRRHQSPGQSLGELCLKGRSGSIYLEFGTCFTLNPLKTCILQEIWKIKKNAKEKQANTSVFLPCRDTTVNILVYFLLFCFLSLEWEKDIYICIYVYIYVLCVYI